MAGADEYEKEVDALGKVFAALSGLEKKGQQFVLRTVADRLNVDSQSISAGPSTFEAPGDHSGGIAREEPSQTPKQFMHDKKPKTDVERVTCLAYYLTHFRDTPHFKRAEITAINTEAALRSLSNPTVALNNAEKQGYLAKGPNRAEKQITTFGEEVAKALPDREAVKAIAPPASRRGAKTKRKTRKKK